MPRATITAISTAKDHASINGLLDIAVVDIRASYFTTVNGINTLTGSLSAYLAELSDADVYAHAAHLKAKT